MITEEGDAGGGLGDEYEGDSVLEFPMQGLVVPHFYSQPGSYAAAEQSYQEQGGLWDTPLPFPGLQFVYAVGCKGRGIYCR